MCTFMHSCNCLSCFITAKITVTSKYTLVELVIIREEKSKLHVTHCALYKMTALSVKKLDVFHTMEYLFPEYLVFLEYFHTTEYISIQWNWTKLWKLDFPTFFYNISKIFPYNGRGLIFPVC